MSTYNKIIHLTRTKEFVPLAFLNSHIDAEAKHIDVQHISKITYYNHPTGEITHRSSVCHNAPEVLHKLYIFREDNWVSRDEFMKIFFEKSFYTAMSDSDVEIYSGLVVSERTSFSFIPGVLIIRKYMSDIGAVITLPEEAYRSFKGVEGFTIQDIASEAVIFVSEQLSSFYVTKLRKVFKEYGGRPKANVNVIERSALYNMFFGANLSELGMTLYDNEFQQSILEKIKSTTPEPETFQAGEDVSNIDRVLDLVFDTNDDNDLESISLESISDDDLESISDDDEDDVDTIDESVIYNPNNAPLPSVEQVANVLVIRTVIRPHEPVRYLMNDGNWLYSSGGTSTVLEPEQAIEAYQECLYPNNFGSWGWVEAGYYVSITEHDGPGSQTAEDLNFNTNSPAFTGIAAVPPFPITNEHSNNTAN